MTFWTLVREFSPFSRSEPAITILPLARPAEIVMIERWPRQLARNVVTIKGNREQRDGEEAMVLNRREKTVAER